MARARNSRGEKFEKKVLELVVVVAKVVRRGAIVGQQGVKVVAEGSE